MRAVFAILLASVLGLPAVPEDRLEEDRSYKVNYDGGSITAFQPGEHMRIDLYQGRLRIFREDDTLLDIVPGSILGISYGEDVRRVGAAVGLDKVSRGLDAFTLGRKAQHYFVGIAWNNQGVKGCAAFRLKKGYKEIVASLEEFSGRKAINTTVAMTLN